MMKIFQTHGEDIPERLRIGDDISLTWLHALYVLCRLLENGPRTIGDGILESAA